MTATAAKLPSMRAKLAFAARRFHAWWEGYAFDEAAELAALQAMFPMAGSPSGRPVEDIVAEAIWGQGRLEPGAPVWTMRYARMLGLPVKAQVIVFGAGMGGPLGDLENGTRWKAQGFTHAKAAERVNLYRYDAAMGRMHKANAQGAISFFQLSQDANPAAFSEFAAELLLPGAKAIFTDYAVVRKGARLPRCFPAISGGSPKTETEYRDALRTAGLIVDEAGDDTQAFLPLIEHGWAGWRRAYEAITHVEDMALRAKMLRAMSVHARLWAERYEALKSGQLRVMFFRASRR
jgi:hypothetical protein